MTARGMANDFAQHLPREQTALMTATQRPLRAAAFDDRTTVAAWEKKPSWYIVATQERMIVPLMQRDLAKKSGATTREIEASHVPQQSPPAEVAQVILDAVDKTAKAAR